MERRDIITLIMAQFVAKGEFDDLLANYQKYDQTQRICDIKKCLNVADEISTQIINIT